MLYPKCPTKHLPGVRNHDKNKIFMAFVQYFNIIDENETRPVTTEFDQEW